MDKSNQHTYRSGNQFLIVERHFTGNKSIEEIVKQYVSEQMRYNYFGEKAAVTSAKGDGK